MATPKSHLPPTPYRVVHFGFSGACGYARFIRETTREGEHLLIQIEEPDGGAEVRLTDEQRREWIAALQHGGAIQ